MADRHDRLAEVVRAEGGRILATLVRTTGSLTVAEDAVQEAVIAALREWGRGGVPSEPRAWLTLTARRKAIDILRREQARTGKEREATELGELLMPDPPPDSVVRDDQLRLVFTCCHPTLSPDARVALALRTLCGLSQAEIAGVLLTSEAAIAKRLTRSRQKIAAANIPYRVPPESELPQRLPAVCAVVHALYTVGHSPIQGDTVTDVDSCSEALRLSRLLVELLPEEPMPAAVLALLVLTEARRPGRTDDGGDVVLLADQDRTSWDAQAIAEGIGLLNLSLTRTEGVADPYQLQAAIAAEHARAPDYSRVDWAEVVRLYDLLLTVAPSANAALSRAVSVSERDGPEAGLLALEQLPTTPRWRAVRGELLARSGRYREAADEVAASLTEQLTRPERRYREGRLRAMRDLAGD